MRRPGKTTAFILSLAAAHRHRFEICCKPHSTSLSDCPLCWGDTDIKSWVEQPYESPYTNGMYRVYSTLAETDYAQTNP